MTPTLNRIVFTALFGTILLTQACFEPASAQLPPGLAASWEGIPSDFTLEPPDPHGAAGPNGVIQVVNVRLEYWTKAGARIWGPTSFTKFFPWAANAFQSDPRAAYDPQAGRFYVEILEIDFNTFH